MEECGEFYEDELEFFWILIDVVGLCCFEEYNDVNVVVIWELNLEVGEVIVSYCECGL